MEKFYGQIKIIREVTFMIDSIKNGENMNILFLAPSGHGKTMLATILLHELGGSHNSHIGIPPNFSFNRDVRFNMLDEVHEHRYPERLYKYMDEDMYTILLATNEGGQLKEPLVNRCIQLMFEPYDQSDLITIAKDALGGNAMGDSVINKVIEYSGGNPRELKILIRRLKIVSKKKKIRTLNDLDTILDTVLNIDTRGLNVTARKYLDFLSSVGGRASLSLISFGTGLDQAALRRDVEPILIQRGLIRISSKGRSVV